jgi:hypothetical protein
MKTTLRHYKILFKISKHFDTKLSGSAYLNSIYGFPDIYAGEHMKIVAHCVAKYQKFDRTTKPILTPKRGWN